MPTKDNTQMTSSDFNMEKLNTKDLSEHVGATIKMGGNLAVFGRRGTGKMLDLETELPTPTGFIKLKDLKEGDQLFDESGKVCSVTHLHPIMVSEEAYEIIFDDDTKVKACADHLWLTWDKRARRSHNEAEMPGIFPSVRNTKEIAGSLKTVSNKPETNHSIQNARPVQYPMQDLPIDPYVLGCWLGGGNSKDGVIECADQTILDNIKKAGYSINLQPSSVDGGASCAYRIGDRVDNPKGTSTIGLLKLQLRNLGILNNKHIPDIYLYSSYEQRLSLLQGLLDTDGTCCSREHENQVEFCSVIPKLAYQTLELANSLGIKARIHQNESWLYDQKCQDRYRVTFITRMPVFRLERKLENLKQTDAQSARNTHRYIIDAKRIESIPMRCITVDSLSHLYLITRAYIPTHNTEIAKYEIKKADFQEVYINLSVLERVDLGGYPNVMAAAQQKKFVDFLLPSFYEPMIDGKRPVVALLDEVDKADSSLWAPLLEFIQFRSINHRPLTNLQAVIMTGNLISEGGSRPSLPLLDRSEKFLVEADVHSWLDWAGRSGRIHPSISAYINDYPQDLFGKVDPEERYADPSPRGWDRASQILFKGEELGWNHYLLNKKVAGCVGKDAGMKYSHYYEHYMELLPMVEEIYAGKDVSSKYAALEPSKKLVACMIACARFATQLDQVEQELPPSVKFMGKFLNKVSHENVLVAVRSQIQIVRLVKHSLDEHVDWAQVLGRINKEVDQ